MTTEQLEQLMQAHKCWFAVMNSDSGYVCELNSYEHDVIGIGTGPSIIEAVYEALKSKMGSTYVKDECDSIINETGVDRLW